MIHAWLSRGMVDCESIAKWHFDGDLSQVADMMKRKKFGMQELLDLQSISENDDVHEEQASRKQDHERAGEALMAGEASSSWCILPLDATADTKPIPLPEWWRIPVDRTIAIWVRERDAWEEKRNKRLQEKGDYKLTPAAEKKYQTWLSHANSRRIILNKKRQTQVVRIENKSLRSISKNCIVTRLLLSNDASSLALQAGNGENFKLCLLQGIEPGDAVPDELDHLAGASLVIYKCNKGMYIYRCRYIYVC